MYDDRYIAMNYATRHDLNRVQYMERRIKQRNDHDCKLLYDLYEGNWSRYARPLVFSKYLMSRQVYAEYLELREIIRKGRSEFLAKYQLPERRNESKVEWDRFWEGVDAMLPLPEIARNDKDEVSAESNDGVTGGENVLTVTASDTVVGEDMSDCDGCGANETDPLVSKTVKSKKDD